MKTFALTGPTNQLDSRPSLRSALPIERKADDEAIASQTGAIIARVRLNGDSELRALAREFDGVDLEAIDVPTQALTTALDSLEGDVRAAMERAIGNIAAAHQAFIPVPAECETEPGVFLRRYPSPLDIVGVYAPGGRAAYPSSVLMGAIPARVAGVRTVVLCSPPSRGTGLPPAVVMAAARLAEVDRVFAIGGAGAIAAMAYGTETVPAVDRIVGPGNAYVAAAKLAVSSVVGIDTPAGPSELLVVMDESASPSVVAREVLAQAEHDPSAAVVVIGLSESIARDVAREVIDSLPSQPRGEIIRSALLSRGWLLWADSVDDALDFAARYAPEHLLLAVRDPERYVGRVRNAGTVFLGESSSVAFGDYMTGANHVLPTGGLSRVYSGLSTDAFMRWTTYQRVTPRAAASLARSTGVFAESENLPAHAAAAMAWMETGREGGRA